MAAQLKWDWVSEDSVLLRPLHNQVSPQLISNYATQLRKQFPEARDLISAADSLLLILPITVSPESLAQRLEKLALTEIAQHSGQHHRIPVCYDEELAPDLNAVAQQLGLAKQAVVELHTQSQYHVEAIGFAPGFAYLAGLPEALRLPRAATPRARVPAGSVAIAENLSAVYPNASPGGWHLIGRCPLSMFNVQHTPPCPFNVGDQVSFYSVSAAEFSALTQQEHS